jgi:acyl-CoA synthetase (AMP-forming)/AMP-acid ligase II
VIPCLIRSWGKGLRLHSAKAGAHLTLGGYCFLKPEGVVLQLPERIEFVDAMPYTGAQKTDKRFLQEDIAKKLKGSE